MACSGILHRAQEPLSSSVVAWPIVFATDVVFGDYILPQVEASAHPDSAVVTCTTIASILPKAAGSFLGAHLYVPHAWWFWKLSLMPALPITFALSVAFKYAVWHDDDSANAVDKSDGKVPKGFNEVGWQETSEEFPQVRRAPPSRVSNTAWAPSSSAKKSLATRFVEAAPNGVQLAILKVWEPPAVAA